ncbi:MAG TPA: hypothetical protein VF005_07040 [Acidimicrobiales bacterium]
MSGAGKTAGVSWHQDLELPADIVTAVDRLVDEMIRRLGASLRCLLIYGGIARGRYRVGQSDVNLMLIVDDATAERVDSIAEPLRAGWLEARVRPYIVAQTELAALAEVFPTLVLDIQRYNVVVQGTNLLSEVTVDTEDLRRRVEQELANIALRLRNRQASVRGNVLATTAALIQAARPLALALGGLLQVAGHPLPSEDRSATLYAEAAKVFGLDANALTQLAELRQDSSAAADADSLYDAVLDATTRAMHAAFAEQPPS